MCEGVVGPRESDEAPDAEEPDGGGGAGDVAPLPAPRIALLLTVVRARA